MNRKSFVKALTVVLAASVLAAAAFSPVAARGGDGGRPAEPVIPAIPAELYIPPNCEVIVLEARGGVTFTYLECHLPPECEVVSEQFGEIGISYIDCDLELGCELKSGEWNGHTFWYIHCNESECIGGCNPVVPPDIGIKGS